VGLVPVPPAPDATRDRSRLSFFPPPYGQRRGTAPIPTTNGASRSRPSLPALFTSPCHRTRRPHVTHPGCCYCPLLLPRRDATREPSRTPCASPTCLPVSVPFPAAPLPPSLSHLPSFPAPHTIAPPFLPHPQPQLSSPSPLSLPALRSSTAADSSSAALCCLLPLSIVASARIFPAAAICGCGGGER
jgi:hypothetical protein